MNEPETRRAHARIEIALPVTVEHGGRALDGMTRNLSLGGMLVDVSETVPLDAALILRFRLPHLGEPMVIPARVRWIAGVSGLGVQFDGLRARQVWELQQLLAPTRTTI